MRTFSKLVIILILLFGCHSKKSTHSIQYQNIPRLYSRVNDYAELINSNDKQKLENLLKSLEDSIGSQIVVLTINSLDGERIEDYSIKVAEKWKVGRANYNDGILITLVKNDRKVRIEVGYGLELIIRDEIAKRIIDSLMIPEFRKEDYYGGLYDASNELIDLIYRHSDLVGKNPYHKDVGKE